MSQRATEGGATMFRDEEYAVEYPESDTVT
jgi:hypothetical protein